MHVNPADAASVQAAVFNKRDYLRMRNGGRVRHLFVFGQKPLATAFVSDQKLSIDEIMSDGLTCIQETLEFGKKGLMAHEETDPDGCVHQDH